MLIEANTSDGKPELQAGDEKEDNKDDEKREEDNTHNSQGKVEEEESDMVNGQYGRGKAKRKGTGCGE